MVLTFFQISLSISQKIHVQNFLYLHLSYVSQIYEIKKLKNYMCYIGLFLLLMPSSYAFKCLAVAFTEKFTV